VTTILLADDDRVVLFTLAEGLRAAGYTVLTAQDGLDALAICRQETVDLALLDIRMPGLGGLELARRLRDETPVPFLFLSAYGDAGLVRQAVALGALGYLVKPLTVAQIRPMLRTTLARIAEMDTMLKTNAGLQRALISNRTIATAVGLLMSREGLGRQAAFEHLRKLARDRSRRVEDVAAEMLDAAAARK